MSIMFLIATLIGTATVMAFVINNAKSTPQPTVLRTSKRGGANR